MLILTIRFVSIESMSFLRKALLIVLIVGLIVFTASAGYFYRRIWLPLEEMKNQPTTVEEAQQRVKFTIFRPHYKPSEFAKFGKLVLFGSDNYVRINYYLKGNLLASQERTIQFNEALATEDQIRGKLKEFLLAEDRNIVGLKVVNICGVTGYTGLAFRNQQELIFVKEKTRILMTVFPIPLTNEELLRVACSMQPILIPY